MNQEAYVCCTGNMAATLCTASLQSPVTSRRQADKEAEAWEPEVRPVAKTPLQHKQKEGYQGDKSRS